MSDRNGVGAMTAAELVRRHWLVFLLPVVALVLLVAVRSNMAVPRFRAETRVLFPVVETDDGIRSRLGSPRAVADQASLVVSDDNAAQVEERTGREIELIAEPDDESNSLIIAAVDQDPEVARQAVDHVAELYLDRLQGELVAAAESASAAARPLLAELESEIFLLDASAKFVNDTLLEDLDVLDDDIDDFSDRADLEELEDAKRTLEDDAFTRLVPIESERRVVLARRSALLERQDELEAAAAAGPAEVQLSGPAVVSDRPIGPSLVLQLALAVLVGIGLGTSLAIAAARRDRRVRSPADVARASNRLSVLGWQAHLGGNGVGPSSPTVSAAGEDTASPRVVVVTDLASSHGWEVVTTIVGLVRDRGRKAVVLNPSSHKPTEVQSRSADVDVVVVHTGSVFDPMTPRWVHIADGVVVVAGRKRARSDDLRDVVRLLGPVTDAPIHVLLTSRHKRPEAIDARSIASVLNSPSAGSSAGRCLATAEQTLVQSTRASELARLLRRRPLSLLLIGLAGIVVGVAVAGVVPTRFEATSTILFSYPATGPSPVRFDGMDPRSLAAEVALLRSPSVAEVVEARVGPHELTVSSDQDTDVVEISVRALSPEVAVEASGHYVETVINRRNALVAQLRSGELDRLSARIDDAAGEVAQLVEAAADDPDLATSSSAQLDRALDELSGLLVARDDQTLSSPDPGVEVLSVDDPSSARTIPDTVPVLVASAIEIAAGLAFLVISGRLYSKVWRGSDVLWPIERIRRGDRRSLQLLAATLDGVVGVVSVDSPNGSPRFATLLAESRVEAGGEVEVLAAEDLRACSGSLPCEQIDRLRGESSLVLIDADPGEAATWNGSTSRCLVVAKEGRTDLSAVRSAVSNLHHPSREHDRVVLVY